MAEINNALALQTKVPEFDLSTPLLTAAKLRAADNQDALTSLTIKEKAGKQNALADYSARTKAGDPKAADALISHPEIYQQVLQVRSSLADAERKTYDDNLVKNARGAQRVAMITDPAERTAAWKEELENARKERRIDESTFKRLYSTPPNDLVLSNIQRAGLSLEEAVKLERAEADRKAGKEALDRVAGAYGNGNTDAPPITTPRPGGPVASSATVVGDQEAEDRGLYEKPALKPGAKVASAAPQGSSPVAPTVPLSTVSATPEAATPAQASAPIATPAIPPAAADPATSASAAPQAPAATTPAPASANAKTDDDEAPTARAPASPVAASVAEAARMPGIGATNKSRIPLLIAAAGMPGIPKEVAAVNLELLKNEIARDTGPMKQYGLYAAQEIAAGRVPSTFEAYEIRQGEAKRSQVNIDQRGQGAFENEFGKKQADRWNGYIQEGDKARAARVDIDNMREISNRLGSQGQLANIKEVLGPYAEAMGVNLEGLSDIQAFSSIIERLAPQQRVPGSGSTSDIEHKGFLRSLPQLVQNPEARTMTIDTMQALNDDKLRYAEIATRLATKEITRSEAEKEIRALPDPMKAFRDWKKANPELYQQAIKAGNERAKSEAAKPAGSAAQPNAKDMSQADIETSISNARTAIANGAPRDRVIEKLKAAGISTDGL